MATSVAWRERMAALFTHWHCCDGKEEDLVPVLKGRCLLGIESTWRKQVKRLACFLDYRLLYLRCVLHMGAQCKLP